MLTVAGTLVGFVNGLLTDMAGQYTDDTNSIAASPMNSTV